MLHHQFSCQIEIGDLYKITEVMVIATKNAMITAIAATIRMPLITYLPYQRNEKIILSFTILIFCKI